MSSCLPLNKSVRILLPEDCGNSPMTEKTLQLSPIIQFMHADELNQPSPPFIDYQPEIFGQLSVVSIQDELCTPKMFNDIGPLCDRAIHLQVFTGRNSTQFTAERVRQIMDMAHTFPSLTTLEFPGLFAHCSSTNGTPVSERIYQVAFTGELPTPENTALFFTYCPNVEEVFVKIHSLNRPVYLSSFLNHAPVKKMWFHYHPNETHAQKRDDWLFISDSTEENAFEDLQLKEVTFQELYISKSIEVFLNYHRVKTKLCTSIDLQNEFCELLNNML